MSASRTKVSPELREKTRRARWDREHGAAVNRIIRTRVLAGATVKELSAELDLNGANVGRRINYLKFRRIYVTAEEAAHIMDRRAKEGRP